MTYIPMDDGRVQAAVALLTEAVRASDAAADARRAYIDERAHNYVVVRRLRDAAHETQAAAQNGIYALAAALMAESAGAA